MPGSLAYRGGGRLKRLLKPFFLRFKNTRGPSAGAGRIGISSDSMFFKPY